MKPGVIIRDCLRRLINFYFDSSEKKVEKVELFDLSPYSIID